MNLPVLLVTKAKRAISSDLPLNSGSMGTSLRYKGTFYDVAYFGLGTISRAGLQGIPGIQGQVYYTLHLHMNMHMNLPLYISYYTLKTKHCTPRVYTACCKLITLYYKTPKFASVILKI